MAVVVCVLLSVLLWFFFSMRRTTGLDITLPTRVVNLPPGESFVVAPPTSVAYRVRADGLSLLPLYFYHYLRRAIWLPELRPSLKQYVCWDFYQPTL